MDEYVTILPSSRIETIQYVTTILNLRKAMIDRDYRQITYQASEAIDLLLKSQLSSLLDIRSHGYFMQGKSFLALQDAASIIQYAPTLTTGYLRQANIYSLCGQQLEAIKSFDDGLKKGTCIDEKHLRFIFRGKMEAEYRNEQGIDFFSKLPTEVVNNIIIRLPQIAYAECMWVSKTWRRKIIHCQDIWNNLVLDDSFEGQEDLSLFTIVAGQYVKRLTINSGNNGVRSRCLHNMMFFKSFTQIQSLTITAATMKNSPPWNTHWSIWMPIEAGILNARSTLTHLDLTLGDNMIKNTTEAAKTLSFCKNLTNVKISAPTTPLSTALPSLLHIEEQYDIRITNLQLNFSSITDNDVEGILRQCKRLQRLVMNGCDDSVFDPLYFHAPNLEIIGYNCYNPDGIPGLEDVDEEYNGTLTESNTHTISQQQRDPPSPQGKLRMFFADTQNSSSAIPAFKIMPLLYKHKETLSTLHINVALKIEKKTLLKLTYPNFTLSKLVDLCTWLPHSMQQFFLDAIRYTTTLKSIHVVKVFNTKQLVTTLLNLPPLDTFIIQEYETIVERSVIPSYDLWVHRRNDFTSFFSTYERRLYSGLYTSSLRSISFRQYLGVTDVSLVALSKINTLRDITLIALEHVTTEGLGWFFDSKVAHGLTSIKLIQMWSATDDIVGNIGSLENIVSVVLEGDFVTDVGVKALVDRSYQVGSLKKLSISNCNVITDECINYSKNKVQHVL